MGMPAMETPRRKPRGKLERGCMVDIAGILQVHGVLPSLCERRTSSNGKGPAVVAAGPMLLSGLSGRLRTRSSEHSSPVRPARRISLSPLGLQVRCVEVVVLLELALAALEVDEAARRICLDEPGVRVGQERPREVTFLEHAADDVLGVVGGVVLKLGLKDATGIEVERRGNDELLRLQ